MKYVDETRAAKNRLFYVYKRDAKKRKLGFKFNINNFVKITSQNCYYCGIEPKQIKKRRSSVYIYNGIDRINNKLGYTYKNSIPCCETCNKAKRHLTPDKFLEWRKRISIHLIDNIDDWRNK